MRKAPLEANAACLDVALNALLTYIEGVDSVAKVRPLIVANLIEKGLGAARGGTKAKTLEILLELVAANCRLSIISESGGFIGHKHPKSVAASIAITEIITNFGCNLNIAKVIIKFSPRSFNMLTSQ